MRAAPDGRHIFHWSGQDRKQDIDELTDAIAAAIELYNQDGKIVRIENRELVPVNLASLRRLIDKSICTVRAVNRGSGWEREYLTYRFPPARRVDASRSGPQLPLDESEPTEEILNEIFRTELLKRLPRVE
jgi:hypothetical protein